MCVCVYVCERERERERERGGERGGEREGEGKGGRGTESEREWGATRDKSHEREIDGLGEDAGLRTVFEVVFVGTCIIVSLIAPFGEKGRNSIVLSCPHLLSCHPWHAAGPLLKREFQALIAQGRSARSFR